MFFFSISYFVQSSQISNSDLQRCRQLFYWPLDTSCFWDKALTGTDIHEVTVILAFDFWPPKKLISPSLTPLWQLDQMSRNSFKASRGLDEREVSVTFDHPNLISSSQSPRWQLWQISLQHILRSQELGGRTRHITAAALKRRIYQ